MRDATALSPTEYFRESQDDIGVRRQEARKAWRQEDKDAPPPPDRAADPSRVSRFEGMTIRDLTAWFAADNPQALDKNLKWKLGNALREHFRFWKRDATERGGDPARVDPGTEALFVAQRFMPSAETSYAAAARQRPKAFPSFYAESLPAQQVRAVDAKMYLTNYWETRRAEYTQYYMRDRIPHPFDQLLDALPLRQVDDLRSVQAFYALADIVAQQLPAAIQARNLEMLYPASGSHIAPLVTAMRLVEQGKVDTVRITETEIDPFAFFHLVRNLQVGTQLEIDGQPLFEKVDVLPLQRFTGEEGWERGIVVTYRGHPITIRFAFQRSGKKYYRAEDFAKADVVVLHDPFTGASGELLLYELLVDKANAQATAAVKPQLAIVEGDPSVAWDASRIQHLPARPHIHTLPGPYGHCYLDHFIYTERGACFYKTAYVVPLHDAPSLALARRAGTPELLHTALKKPQK